MQPKDFTEKTPENDRRLQKRLEIMAKDLDVQKAATGKYMTCLYGKVMLVYCEIW